MRKADEMEMYIALKSSRLAWTFSIIFLLIWSWWEYGRGGNFGLPFILLSGQLVVFWSSQIILRRIMAGKNEEQD